MIRAILGAGLAVFACHGQSFEVASIKPAPPPEAGRRMFMGMTGGPGSPTPGLFSCNNCSLPMLLVQAYDIKPYQLSGGSAFEGERFNISAKVPAGTTKEDFRIMQQNLLAERFKLKIHREKKEMQVYELVVAKNGPKLKDAAPEPAAPEDAPPPPPAFPPGPPKLDKDGFPEMPAGARGPVMFMMPGRARMKANGATIDQLIGLLSGQMGKPVVDGTGLKGKYDIALAWAPEGMIGPMGRGGPMPPPFEGGGPPPPAPDGESGPTLIGALQEQLGLRLEQKKGLVDIVVIDHMEKVPTEN